MSTKKKDEGFLKGVFRALFLKTAGTFVPEMAARIHKQSRVLQNYKAWQKNTRRLSELSEKHFRLTIEHNNERRFFRKLLLEIRLNILSRKLHKLRSTL